MPQPRAPLGTSLDDLLTEARDPAGADLDLRSTDELVALMNAGNAGVPAAVEAAAPAVVAGIDAIVGRLRTGGRLVYVGAGTSGGLAAVDAVECEATFASPPGQVVALVAERLAGSSDADGAAEDDADAGRAAIRELGVGRDDAVVGISASGRTPFVVAALDSAREAGALTVAVVSVDGSVLGRAADHEIAVPVGAELIAGSTRLKAGTAQKLILNMLSTVAMIRLGRTFGNLMVDVVATNEKLHERVRRIVREATGAADADIDAALASADGDAKVAILSLLAGIAPEAARARLAATGGSLRAALGP